MARKVDFLFDPFEIAGVNKADLDKSIVTQALADVRDYVLEAVLSDTADQRSAVTGRPFPKLNPNYAKQKKAAGHKPVPNLEFDGDMLSALQVIPASAGRLKLQVSPDQADKADGHNNHSGESRLPPRKFIPNADADETFRPAIRAAIKDIVMVAVEKQIDKNTAGAKTDEEIEALAKRGVKISLRQFLE